MKYIVKQKLVTLKPKYEILDGASNPIYKVQGSFFGRERFELTDLEGQVVAQCHTDMNILSFFSYIFRDNFKKYHITVDDKKQFSLARTLNIFTSSLKVASPLGAVQIGYGINGSHQFILDGKVLCDIQKCNLKIGGDEYHVEVDDTQDPRVFLSSVIALDRIVYTTR